MSKRAGGPMGRLPTSKSGKASPRSGPRSKVDKAHLKAKNEQIAKRKGTGVMKPTGGRPRTKPRGGKEVKQPSWGSMLSLRGKPRRGGRPRPGGRDGIGKPPKGYKGMKPPKNTGPGGGGGKKPMTVEARKNAAKAWANRNKPRKYDPRRMHPRADPRNKPKGGRKLSQDLKMLEAKYKKSGARELAVLKLEKSKGKRLKERKESPRRRIRNKKSSWSSRSIRAAGRAGKNIKTKAGADKFRKSGVYKRAKASADKIRGSSKYKRAAAKARSLQAGLERSRHSASKKATRRPARRRPVRRRTTRRTNRRKR